MIPTAFRLLYDYLSAPVAPIRTPAPAMVEQPATEASSRCASVATTEHGRLSANTAELWFALVARLGS